MADFFLRKGTFPPARSPTLFRPRLGLSQSPVMSLLSQSISENRRTLALATPMVAGHVGQMLMGWADTIMVGRVGVVELAACAFANTVLSIPFVFGFGLLSGVSVRTSHAFGAQRERNCGEALRFGLLIASVVGVLIASAIQLGMPWIHILGQSPEVNKACQTFLILGAWSVIPAFITTVSKSFSEALARPWVPFWIIIGGVLLNIGLNWVLIYGNLGSPALGLTGAGIATLIARCVVMAVTLGYILRGSFFQKFRPLAWFTRDHSWEVGALLRLGLPAGAMHLAEVSGFGFGSLMMGWLSIDAMAAHQIAITCAATTFMIPLGVSQAVAVRVGRARGAQEYDRCRPIIAGALGLILLIMAGFTLVFILGGPTIAGWFVNNAAVVALAAQLMLIAGLFQICDGWQIVCSGALRGFEDTRVPMIIGIISYWVVAIPFSYFVAFHGGVGPQGVWLGFVVGLIVAAIALGWRVHRQLEKIVKPS